MTVIHLLTPIQSPLKNHFFLSNHKWAYQNLTKNFAIHHHSKNFYTKWMSFGLEITNNSPSLTIQGTKSILQNSFPSRSAFPSKDPFPSTILFATFLQSSHLINSENFIHLTEISIPYSFPFLLRRSILLCEVEIRKRRPLNRRNQTDSPLEFQSPFIYNSEFVYWADVTATSNGLSVIFKMEDVKSVKSIRVSRTRGLEVPRRR
jgi:hypothetical protein